MGGDAERPTSVERLLGNEGGVWTVTTATSHYVFDLDHMTVTRHRGANAPESINDTTRPIAQIQRCEVGFQGAWTMKPEGELANFLEDFWQVSSAIKSIERDSKSGSYEP